MDRTKRNPLTKFICAACKAASRDKATHPGARHLPGTCDCPCRE